MKDIFNDDVVRDISLWVADGCDGTDLIGAVEYAAEMKVPCLSVSPSSVPVIWPWVEKLNVKIVPRFRVENISENTMSKLAIDVNSVFKQGANGAQIILKLNDLEKFTGGLKTVRDDLFFDKDLSVGIDVFEIWPLDWEHVFNCLNKLNATSLLLILTHDDMEKSDFTGRIYGALANWDADKNMGLHVMLGESHGRAEQVYRLVAAMRPELLDKLKIFVSY